MNLRNHKGLTKDQINDYDNASTLIKGHNVLRDGYSDNFRIAERSFKSTGNVLMTPKQKKLSKIMQELDRTRVMMYIFENRSPYNRNYSNNPWLRDWEIEEPDKLEKKYDKIKAKLDAELKKYKDAGGYENDNGELR